MADSSESQTLVLIGIDPSKQAKQALEWYLEHLHKPENRLLLVHVAEPPVVAAQQAMYMSGDLWGQLMEKEKEKVKELEEQYAHTLREKGIAGTIRGVFHSRPGEAIVEVANEEKASFIIMGTRGLGTVRRTILGSVSDYVVHHAHCPVTVCRH